MESEYLKDYRTLRTESLKNHLQGYLKKYKPGEYLFEGQIDGKYSGSSLAKIVKRAAGQVGIQQHVTPHTLPHSFATHLIEDATDIRYIQELLGHNSIKTTERYTHVANTTQQKVTSPLDKLNRSKKPP